MPVTIPETDFQWDERYFPNPAGMLCRVRDKGTKVCVWINPYIAAAFPLFDESAAQSFLLCKPHGDGYQVDDWQPGMALEFPDGRPYLYMQYMFGRALLVAPVFAADSTVSYYQPEGEWRHLLTGQVVRGPGWRKEQYNYFSLPLCTYWTR